MFDQQTEVDLIGIAGGEEASSLVSQWVGRSHDEVFTILRSFIYTRGSAAVACRVINKLKLLSRLTEFPA